MKAIVERFEEPGFLLAQAKVSSNTLYSVHLVIGLQCYTAILSNFDLFRNKLVHSSGLQILLRI